MKWIPMVWALGLLGIISSPVRAEEWNKHWTVGPKPELHVIAQDASIKVEVGNSDGIDANLRTHNWGIGESGVRVIEHQSGNRLDIEIREPRHNFSFGDHSIHLELRVPRDLTADIRTGDGSVTLNGLHGTLRVATGDGSIQGEDLDGLLDARSGDGSVHVRGRFDNLQLRTQDGSVDVNAAEGSRLQEDWRIQTGDGSVHFGVPRNLAADLEISTGDGSIHLDFPVTVNGTQSNHQLRGKMNGGGPLLTIRTGDGSVTVNSI